jgi:hypothetical protein
MFRMNPVPQAALELAADQRADYLRKACADEEFRQRVSSLLRFDSRIGCG